MADVEPVKKGGNKAVIIGVSIVMLLTGGFFGLRMRSSGGAAGAGPVEKLGDILPVHEFLVNFSNDSSKYLRTEISVQADSSFHKDELDKNQDAIMDAIVSVLREQTMNSVSSAQDMSKLRKEIAAAANDAYWNANPEKTLPDPAKAKPEPTWDSSTGPILKIYFTSFAYQ